MHAASQLLQKTAAQDEDSSHSASTSERLGWSQILCIALFGAVALGLLIDAFTTGYLIGLLEGFLNWLSQLNVLLLTVILLASIVVAQALAVPTAILGTGASFVYVNKIGVLWGVLLSTSVTLAGCIGGACLAFWLGRHMLQVSK